jgi:xylulose-5-phosphate/fructose-6-phosphate phosphoketolase
LIVIDKQSHLQYLDMDAAREHCTRGASTWHWASNHQGEAPDIVLACAGDVMTQETLAAAWLLRRFLPRMHVRVVNIVDLMRLWHPSVHPHGMDEASFIELFTSDVDVVFAFHGYPRAIHEIVHGRPNAQRFHVRGYSEHGTTTTPFDMVALNRVSRYHLVMEAVRRAPRMQPHVAEITKKCEEALKNCRQFALEQLEDPPEITNWKWSDA